MRKTSKVDLDVEQEDPAVAVQSENREMPYWDGEPAFHRKTTLEEWNRGWVEGAKVRSMDVLIGKVDWLLRMAAALCFIMAAELIFLVAHVSK